MLLHELNFIIQNVNITILPIIIVPVTGICCLVFYNRLAAVNSAVHTCQRELRELLTGASNISKDRKQELIATLRDEQHKLLQRSRLIRNGIVCCFSGLIAFVLSAISIMLGIFWPTIVVLTLALWLIGAAFFSIGLVMGIFEIKNSSFKNITLQTALIDEWIKQDQLDV